MSVSNEPAGAVTAPHTGTWRAWLVAARIPTLSVAVAPVLVGSAAAVHGGAVQPWAAVGALIVALAIQVGTNLSNDVLDFMRGADTPSRRGPVRATASGLLAPKRVAAGAVVCFGVAGLVGAVFALRYGWPVVLVGAMAIGAGLGYTAGPWPLGYHGLGELSVFAFFGVVAVVGTAYVQTGVISALAVAASVPVGLVATAVLVVNNLRDAETDRAAGKRTLAVRLGRRGTTTLYVACLAGAGAAPVFMRAWGLVGGWFWLPWLAVPLGATLVRAVVGNADAATLNRALRKTAELDLWLGLLLGASMLLGAGR